MSKVELIGWERGLDTVALINAVRTHGTLSLADAKRAVERLLEGETVSLDFPNENEKSKFLAIAGRLGVMVR